MMSGQFNKVIAIYDPIEITNEYGEKETVYRFSRATRAKVEISNGSRTNENNEIVYNHSKTIYVRSYITINDTSVIVYQDKDYRVTNIEKRDEYDDIMISVEEINE